MRKLFYFNELPLPIFTDAFGVDADGKKLDICRHQSIAQIVFYT
jgi:hypothetical protein